MKVTCTPHAPWGPHSQGVGMGVPVLLSPQCGGPECGCANVCHALRTSSLGVSSREELRSRADAVGTGAPCDPPPTAPELTSGGRDQASALHHPPTWPDCCRGPAGRPAICPGPGSLTRPGLHPSQRRRTWRRCRGHWALTSPIGQDPAPLPQPWRRRSRHSPLGQLPERYSRGPRREHNGCPMGALAAGGCPHGARC